MADGPRWEFVTTSCRVAQMSWGQDYPDGSIQRKRIAHPIRSRHTDAMERCKDSMELLDSRATQVNKTEDFHSLRDDYLTSLKPYSKRLLGSRAALAYILQFTKSWEKISDKPNFLSYETTFVISTFSKSLFDHLHCPFTNSSISSFGAQMDVDHRSVNWISLSSAELNRMYSTCHVNAATTNFHDRIANTKMIRSLPTPNWLM